MSASTFGRLLGTFFGASVQIQPRTVQTSEHSSPIEVGMGSAKERHIAIAGQPTLFRDEGGVVVQFRPAFGYELKPTAVGLKLIPALAPHWEVLREHKGTLTDAIAAAVKDAHSPEASPAHSVNAEKVRFVPLGDAQRQHDVVDAVVLTPPATTDSSPRRTERARYGVLKEWGEKEFPDGKRPGKTYESFCITLAHRGGLDVLQGEGLRDAIAEANCKVGDRIEVRRLGKTKVPAVDKRGRPKLDASGAQVLWDKWLWSIKKS
ncbi:MULTISPECIES: hypothetical protein [unclassified Caballeronia]|uniref:hypothetical protein n=1 Tax=unclassified Caballeronia TaxID=2646786 RepID=UPI002866DE30|nr:MULTISPECIES: hypothetical protein [unclassified Caballeronia]MDR5776887.1 hypothetical protein [Caballeronia sp. LZ002]MDR5798807.1 hypothetical protein [Caballeronia sp. LZ001]MDR5852328.1 hypothetical protein [Caballeronia sp. LZ003]